MAERPATITALAFTIAILVGAAAGIGGFTVGYADSLSYLTDDSEACGNCHVMQGHLDAWAKSSHGKFAACNDCHAPHGSLASKYICKARNGFFHSLAFTTGNFPDNLLITDYNRGVTEGACRHCHADVTHRIDLRPSGRGSDEPVACLRCHANVGHDR